MIDLRRPNVIAATYRIVTPMFCSGADQSSAELRLSSFKGALRFWWRSLKHGVSTRELHAQEAALFGSSSTGVGQSRIRMRLTDVEIAHSESGDGIVRSDGTRYLGFGLQGFGDKPSRQMIREGAFTVQIRLSPHLSAKQEDEVGIALVLLGTVGGLGSRSRKGFGSLTLTKLVQNDNELPLSESVEERLKSAVMQNSAIPSWTAWSRSSRVVAVELGAASCRELLENIGKEEIFFRSWGSNNQVLGDESERNFKNDHDRNAGTLKDNRHPDRVVFGLPHNYRKKPDQVKPASYERRSSPLFVHLHQVSEQSRAVGIVVFLPSLFLPDGERVNSFGQSVPLNRAEDFWYPIHAFLDRLINDGERPKSRAGYEKFPEESKWWQKKTGLVGQEVNLG